MKAIAKKKLICYAIDVDFSEDDTAHPSPRLFPDDMSPIIVDARQRYIAA